MGSVSDSLVAKLEAAGLTDEEKLVLAVAVLSGADDTDDDVVGFASFDLESGLVNFQMQRMLSTFYQAETLASSLQPADGDTTSGTIGKAG